MESTTPDPCPDCGRPKAGSFAAWYDMDANARTVCGVGLAVLAGDDPYGDAWAECSRLTIARLRAELAKANERIAELEYKLSAALARGADDAERVREFIEKDHA